MLDMLQEIVETEYDKFISPNLYNNLATLERKKTGKIEHSASGHDDSLMAYLIFPLGSLLWKMLSAINLVLHQFHLVMNVRVVSSQENFSKPLESLIVNANMMDTAVATLSENPIYNQLVAQQRIMESNENKQLSSFYENNRPE